MEAQLILQDLLHIWNLYTEGLNVTHGFIR